MQLQLLEETAQRHRWTVTSFHKLAEAGIFTEDDRIELIDGELIKMAPIGDEHAGQVNWLSNELAYRLHQQVIVGELSRAPGSSEQFVELNCRHRDIEMQLARSRASLTMILIWSQVASI